MNLKEIKQWREESTLEEASQTFISRIERLIEIAEAAEDVVVAWDNFCEANWQFNKGFEDHITLYRLSEIIREKF